jgi:hypothetical protein
MTDTVESNHQIGTTKEDPKGENSETGDTQRSDEELLQAATRLLRDDELLPAARLLRRVTDRSLLDSEHNEGMRLSEFMEAAIDEMMADPGDDTSGWKKQGESHGHRDTLIYYKVEEGSKLKCRIETPIESSLFAPFLATLNETDLYQTWIPSWSFPLKLGIDRSLKLQQKARVNQIVQISVNMPLPLKKRELILHGFAHDDIDAHRRVGIKLMTMRTGDEDGLVPPPEKGTVRMDFDGGVLFRQCPPDHPALKHSKANYPKDEHLILVTFIMYADPLIAVIPHAFMNWVTRTVIGHIWRMILTVAEDVRDGNRPKHAELMESKRDELYDWVEQRVQALFEGFDDHTKQEDRGVEEDMTHEE